MGKANHVITFCLDGMKSFYRSNLFYQVVDHDWGELDKDATRKENAVTSRLAACNLDWDRVTAKDLFG